MHREEKMDKEVSVSLCLCDFNTSYLVSTTSLAQPFPFEDLFYISCFLASQKLTRVGNNRLVSLCLCRC